MAWPGRRAGQGLVGGGGAAEAKNRTGPEAIPSRLCADAKTDRQKTSGEIEERKRTTTSVAAWLQLCSEATQPAAR